MNTFEYNAEDSSTALIKLDKSPFLCPLTITSALSGTYNGVRSELELKLTDENTLGWRNVKKEDYTGN